jgi:hypothetical protein
MSNNLESSLPGMKRTESGSAATILIIVVLAVLAVGAAVFGVWAYSGRQDYKNNSDKKTAAAVAAAEASQKTQLQTQFDQEIKQPYKTFTGSSTYGLITFNYPNTWSSYVDQTNSSEPINGYFNPGDVPGTSSNSAFALRLELTSNAYNDVIGQFSSQVTGGTVTATAYVPPKMKGVANAQTGTLLTGTISQNNSGSLQGEMLVIPVRDKTLQLYTLSNDYLSDFNNIVLANLKFVP